MLKALGRLLDSEGLGTEKFTEPARFLTYAQDHAVRLAVIDIRMPGQTGLEVQAALHALQPQASVIVMTAEDEPAHRAALAGGAEAFFLKPLDDHLFLAAVHRALHGSETRPS